MNSTAVLVFASLEHSARKFPRLASEAGRSVFAALTLRAVDLGCQAFGEDAFLSVPAHECHEFESASVRLLPQNGANFGERLCTSIEQVFGLGYERVLVVGNDSPQLDLPVLIRCRENFQTASALLGPDHRGGVYLLGVTRSSFHLLSGICWNTNSDFSQLVLKCEQQDETVAILDARSDLDSPADLRRILQDTQCQITREVRHLLRRLLGNSPGMLSSSTGVDVTPSVLRSIRIMNQLPPPLF
ncbi:MAG: DUF2064 domain-containing protein [Acidobacteria bacterium]|nr:DUF2064 domain-containing protein [Acidobacteriota bacterium]MCI0720903.1 DUF2064 domain-containing protein [Acidobacteriota bacterium]